MAQFVRTHRSWVVNIGHLRELRPLGGGDFEVRLEGGLAIPLSRRFSEALDRFRLMDSNDVVA
jgi:DNA-binding LytR/AlgR family response regulator